MIYIAPFTMCSRRLEESRKKMRFNFFLNLSIWSTIRTLLGSPFQRWGPATEKARSPACFLARIRPFVIDCLYNIYIYVKNLPDRQYWLAWYCCDIHRRNTSDLITASAIASKMSSSNVMRGREKHQQASWYLEQNLLDKNYNNYLHL